MKKNNKIKVLINVHQGHVDVLTNNKDIDIILVDRDLIDIGINPVSKVEYSVIKEPFYQQYNMFYDIDMEIYNGLKRLKV